MPAPNWDGLDPPWRPDPATDLRELVPVAKFPFGALAPRTTPIHHKFWHQDQPHFLQVTPVDPARGLATVSDLDVLVVAATYLTHHLNDMQTPQPTLALRPAEILRALNRSLGGEQHRHLHAALVRLHNSEVTTTLGPRPGLVPDTFRLLDHIAPADAHGRLGLTLPPWFLQHIEAHAMMQIDAAALTLRGLERRLYSWARAHLGATGASWAISLPRAHAKAASQNKLRKFRHTLVTLAARNALPGFTLALARTADAELLTLSRRPGPTPPPDAPLDFTPLQLDERPAAAADAADSDFSDFSQGIFTVEPSDPD